MSLETALTDYETNADYDVANSLEKAKLFIVAARRLLVLLPQRADISGTTAQYSPNLIRQAMNAAIAWHNRNSGSASAVQIRTVRLQDGFIDS